MQFAHRQNAHAVPPPSLLRRGKRSTRRSRCRASKRRAAESRRAARRPDTLRRPAPAPAPFSPPSLDRRVPPLRVCVALRCVALRVRWSAPRLKTPLRFFFSPTPYPFRSSQPRQPRQPRRPSLYATTTVAATTHARYDRRTDLEGSSSRVRWAPATAPKLPRLGRCHTPRLRRVPAKLQLAHTTRSRFAPGKSRPQLQNLTAIPRMRATKGFHLRASLCPYSPSCVFETTSLTLAPPLLLHARPPSQLLRLTLPHPRHHVGLSKRLQWRPRLPVRRVWFAHTIASRATRPSQQA